MEFGRLDSGIISDRSPSLSSLLWPKSRRNLMPYWLHGTMPNMIDRSMSQSSCWCILVDITFGVILKRTIPLVFAVSDDDTRGP